MTVTLQKIDGSNFRQIIGLKVKPEQEKFVANNTYSLAQAYAEPRCTPWAIYAGGQPVGFLMTALDDEDDEYWIYRLMIAEGEQGKGYGRAAMEQAIAAIRREHPERRLLYISFEPSNEGAKRLYTSLGFVDDGRVDDGEVIYRLDF